MGAAIALVGTLAAETSPIPLRENRSQSSAISLLLREALAARRKSAVEQDDLMRVGIEQRFVNLTDG